MECVKDGLKIVAVEIIYGIVVIIFLVKLNHLNQELLALNTGAFGILYYNDCIAIQYFSISLILFIIGVAICWIRAKSLMNLDMEIRKYIIRLLAIIFLIILLILLIIFINNPILRSILIAILSISGIGYVSSNQ